MIARTVASPAQCRAAHAFLGWSQQELARRAGVARNTVTQFEVGRRTLQRRIRADITAALEAAGIEFIPEQLAAGEGVRLREIDTRQIRVDRPATRATQAPAEIPAAAP